MATLATVRHDPTPRNSSIPLNTAITVRVLFVQSCPDCRAIVEAFSSACLHDSSVTSYTATPGNKHCHDVLDGERTLPLENGEPISDTNGSAPELVEAAALFDPPPPGLNGFDPK